MACKQCGIPQCAHSLNAPCPLIKHGPVDGSLEPKHVCQLCINDYICVVFN